MLTWFACLFIWAGFAVMIGRYFSPRMNVQLTRGACYFLLAIGVALLFVAQAHARNINGEYDNAPNHKWFAAQHNAQGQWCCDKADGHEFDGNYTMNDDGSVTLHFDDGRQLQIAKYKVLTGPNPTGHAIWWHADHPNSPYDTYCFIAGGES